MTSFKRSPLAMTTTKLILPSCFIRPPARALPAAALSAMRTASDSSCSTDFRAMMLSKSSRSPVASGFSGPILPARAASLFGNDYQAIEIARGRFSHFFQVRLEIVG
ncbi:hypothetical protein GWE18_34920 [Bradyrhizobium sp. CSA112]|uniref:hypothetical protein n=1 Tax=Bradyrhizobium sp. CSA112 TaxID=2699170 RepID=UPI0023AF059F|nr:hypothetical protein [Bradyrhizobium sp. CSA112]MDE5457914.1 hypothetical protein [Bradyrhizobium sp. CSA112]